MGQLYERAVCIIALLDTVKTGWTGVSCAISPAIGIHLINSAVQISETAITPTHPAVNSVPKINPILALLRYLMIWFAVAFSFYMLPRNHIFCP
jgi:hypothetical protein